MITTETNRAYALGSQKVDFRSHKFGRHSAGVGQKEIVDCLATKVSLSAMLEKPEQWWLPTQERGGATGVANLGDLVASIATGDGAWNLT